MIELGSEPSNVDDHRRPWTLASPFELGTSTLPASLVQIGYVMKKGFLEWGASATADGLAPEGASQTKKFCLQVIKKRPRKKFCLQVIKKRPHKPDVADVHEWCSAATEHVHRLMATYRTEAWLANDRPHAQVQL
ncbi:hypothetical protein EVAR_41288_1 [Eumeta japonica]|uniref:Uncharacterized protein n=1 Tax=Eumeta variegata TaxID=151549 RepID=A0A4C1X881_EUMVA|nr:hypothetical protein EVAR_41288_1 [Eumeta japonica]